MANSSLNFQITNMILFSPVSLMLLLVASVITFLLCLFLNKKSCNEKKLPPGPKTLPFIGNLHQLSSSPNISIPKLAKQHGPIMFLQLGSVPTLVISSADAVRDIFKSNDLVFSNRPQLHVAGKLSYNFKNMSFAPYGDYWREIRKISILELFSLKRIKSFHSIRRQETEIFIDSIASSSEPVDLNMSIRSLTSNMVTRIMFGKKYGGTSKFDRLLYQVQELLGGFCFSDYFPKLGWLDKLSGLDARIEETFNELDMFYDDVIEEHLDPNRCQIEHEDFVDVLLRIQKDSDHGISLTYQEIKGVITDMFVAGTDTSASTLIWAMTELIRNPLVLKTAQDELRKTLSRKKKVEESDLPQLIYLKSVVKETLRLHPPVRFLVPRETTAVSTVGEYRIPAKTRVLIDASSVGKDLNYWDAPAKFKPERFLNSCVDFRGTHFEFIPFGAGRRGCPGMNFGVLVVEFVLAHLLYHFDWKLPDGRVKDDLDMEELFGLTVFKKTPLRLVPFPINL